MTWPTPKGGQIIRYAYLWEAQAVTGQEEGLKDRPCVVAAAWRTKNDEMLVVAAPISHSPPRDPDAAVEIPPRTRRRVGLDDERQWIVLSEVNTFVWPGPDLRPLREAGLQSVIIGVLPSDLFTLVNERLQVRITARKVAITRRSQ